LPSSFFKM